VSSQRKKIRKAIQSILKNKTLAEGRVYTNQSTASWAEDLPIILIYARSEDLDVFNEAPKEWKRTINWAIEVIAKGPEDPIEDDGCDLLEDIIDDIAEKIECELSRDDTLNCTVDEVNLASVEFAYEGDGETPIGSARLIYQTTHYTSAPESIDKQANVTDFKSAEIDWSVGHDGSDPGNESPDNIDEATDVVVIP